MPERDVASLADRLYRALMDRELCERMGQAGRAKMEREYDLGEVVEELEERYDEALKLGPRSRASSAARLAPSVGKPGSSMSTSGMLSSSRLSTLRSRNESRSSPCSNTVRRRRATCRSRTGRHGVDKTGRRC